MDVLKHRYERRVTAVASQLSVEKWQKMTGEPTHADAITDRRVHKAYRIERKKALMGKENAR